MILAYRKIYEDVKRIVNSYGSRNPKTIIDSLPINLLPFRSNTRVLGMYKVILRNRFIFYNPNMDENLYNMVLAHELGHDMYHKKEASKNDLIEYQLFDIKNFMEVEANIFAAHLLLDEDELFEYVKEGYTYDHLARAFSVNVNLIIIKLNEMQRLGYPIRRGEANNKFFAYIDGKKSISNEF